MMNPLENVTMAVKTITANKLRSSLTMLGIIIGNASVVAMVAIGQGAQEFTKTKLESFGPNQLTIFPGVTNSQGFVTERSEIVLADVEAIITQAPAVKQIAPQIIGAQRVSYQGRSIQGSVTGTTIGILYGNGA